MSPRHANRVTYFSWALRIENSAAVLIGGLLSVGATAETALEGVGLLALVASIGLAVRAARMGVHLDDSSCVVRNLVRTRRVGVHEAERFGFEPNPWMLFGNETTVLRTTSGRAIRISGLTLPVPSSLQGPGRERCSALNAELKKRQA
jgi:hypothetical protein